MKERSFQLSVPQAPVNPRFFGCATLLTLIDDGEVSYMGNKTVWTENGKVCLPNKTKLKEIQSCFGLVFQNFNLFPHYTVMKNITDAPIHVQKRNKR